MISQYDVAALMAILNMLKVNLRPEIYRTLLAMLSDFDPKDIFIRRKFNVACLGSNLEGVRDLQDSNHHMQIYSSYDFAIAFFARIVKYIKLLIKDQMLLKCLLMSLPEGVANEPRPLPKAEKILLPPKVRHKKMALCPVETAIPPEKIKHPLIATETNSSDTRLPEPDGPAKLDTLMTKSGSFVKTDNVTNTGQNEKSDEATHQKTKQNNDTTVHDGHGVTLIQPASRAPYQSAQSLPLSLPYHHQPLQNPPIMPSIIGIPPGMSIRQVFPWQPINIMQSCYVGQLPHASNQDGVFVNAAGDAFSGVDLTLKARDTVRRSSVIDSSQPASSMPSKGLPFLNSGPSITRSSESIKSEPRISEQSIRTTHLQSQKSQGNILRDFQTNSSEQDARKLTHMQSQKTRENLFRDFQTNQSEQDTRTLTNLQCQKTVERISKHSQPNKSVQDTRTLIHMQAQISEENVSRQFQSDKSEKNIPSALKTEKQIHSQEKQPVTLTKSQVASPMDGFEVKQSLDNIGNQKSKSQTTSQVGSPAVGFEVKQSLGNAKGPAIRTVSGTQNAHLLISNEGEPLSKRIRSSLEALSELTSRIGQKRSTMPNERRNPLSEERNVPNAKRSASTGSLSSMDDMKKDVPIAQSSADFDCQTSQTGVIKKNRSPSVLDETQGSNKNSAKTFPYSQEIKLPDGKYFLMNSSADRKIISLKSDLKQASVLQNPTVPFIHGLSSGKPDVGQKGFQYKWFPISDSTRLLSKSQGQWMGFHGNKPIDSNSNLKCNPDIASKPLQPAASVTSVWSGDDKSCKIHLNKESTTKLITELLKKRTKSDSQLERTSSEVKVKKMRLHSDSQVPMSVKHCEPMSGTHGEHTQTTDGKESNIGIQENKSTSKDQLLNVSRRGEDVSKSPVSYSGSMMPPSSVIDSVTSTEVPQISNNYPDKDSYSHMNTKAGPYCYTDNISTHTNTQADSSRYLDNDMTTYMNTKAGGSYYSDNNMSTCMSSKTSTAYNKGPSLDMQVQETMETGVDMTEGGIKGPVNAEQMSAPNSVDTGDSDQLNDWSLIMDSCSSSDFDDDVFSFDNLKG